MSISRSMAGIYARACQLANPKDDRSALLKETASMRDILEELLSSIYASSNEDGEVKASSIWVSADESEAVSSALAPKLKQAERGVEELLFEVVTLQVAPTPTVLNLRLHGDKDISFPRALRLLQIGCQQSFSISSPLGYNTGKVSTTCGLAIPGQISMIAIASCGKQMRGVAKSR